VCACEVAIEICREDTSGHTHSYTYASTTRKQDEGHEYHSESEAKETTTAAASTTTTTQPQNTPTTGLYRRKIWSDSIAATAADNNNIITINSVLLVVYVDGTLAEGIARQRL
jgi:hypothetical protein